MNQQREQLNGEQETENTHLQFVNIMSISGGTFSRNAKQFRLKTKPVQMSEAHKAIEALSGSQEQILRTHNNILFIG